MMMLMYDAKASAVALDANAFHSSFVIDEAVYADDDTLLIRG